MNRRSVDYDGTIAALPLAAAFTLLLARWLPIHFEYHPNDLGIVSWATEHQYPVQQETFWVVFAVAAGAVFTWLLARVFRRSSAAVGSIIAVEALGGLSLLALLWLPAPARRARRPPRRSGGGVALGANRGVMHPGPPSAASPPAFPQRTAFSSALWVSGAVLLALALSPGLWAALRNVAQSIPDERLVREAFSFQGEQGQHLAWANAVLHGGFQGKDFFCLYGPLLSLGIVGFWALLGRSIVVWWLYLVSDPRPGAVGLPAPGRRAGPAAVLGARDSVPGRVGQGAARCRPVRPSLPLPLAPQRKAPLAPDRRGDRRDSRSSSARSSAWCSSSPVRSPSRSAEISVRPSSSRPAWREW